MTDQLSPYPVDAADDSRPAGASSILPWILLILVLVPVLACGVLTVIAVGGVNQAVDIVEELLNGGELVVRANRTPAIITQVRELGRLETASYTIERVIEGGVDQGNDVLNLLLGDRLLLVAHGEVIAGLDLSQLPETDVIVSADRQSVTLRLPPAHILTHRLDNEKSWVYDRRQGLLSKGDPGLESEVRRAAEQEILRAACEAGILVQATENAQRQLQLLLHALEFEQVEFLPGEEWGGTGCE